MKGRSLNSGFSSKRHCPLLLTVPTNKTLPHKSAFWYLRNHPWHGWVIEAHFPVQVFIVKWAKKSHCSPLWNLKGLTYVGLNCASLACNSKPSLIISWAPEVPSLKISSSFATIYWSTVDLPKLSLKVLKILFPNYIFSHIVLYKWSLPIKLHSCLDSKYELCTIFHKGWPLFESSPEPAHFYTRPEKGLHFLGTLVLLV